MRRKNPRRTAATTAADDGAATAVEPMDEDEQQALVDKFDEESTQQLAQIDQVFRYLCITAAILCILCTAYIHRTTTSKTTTTTTSSLNDSGSESSSNNIQLTLFQWTHGVLASLLHLLSIRVVLVRKGTPSTMRVNVWTSRLPLLPVVVVLNLLVASMALFHARRSLQSSSSKDAAYLFLPAHDDAKQESASIISLHYGLVISNLLVLCTAILLRWDAQSTEKAMQELKDARYQHKSL
jgi:hypothetical protein